MLILKTPLASPIMIKVPQINPRSTTKESLTVLYFNTALANEYTIHYKIYASTLTDPVEGEIVVNVGQRALTKEFNNEIL